MLKIALDNVSMRNRILDSTPYYKVKDYKEHMTNHKHLLQMHCEYPLILEKKSDKPHSSYAAKGTPIHASNVNLTNPDREDEPVELKSRQFKIGKGKELIKLNLTSEGLTKELDHKVDANAIRIISIMPK